MPPVKRGFVATSTLPELLIRLRKHECILVHAEAGYRKVTLPPLEADGTVSKWYHGLWLGS
jgi:hypothetical protein